MKKLSLFFAGAILFCTAANAQLKKGDVIIGADIANFKVGLNKGSGYDIKLSPFAAKFISDNLAVGAKLDFSVSGSKGASTYTSYGVTAMGRYYISDPKLSVLKHARFFAEATAGIQGDNISEGNSTNGFGFSFGPGVTYFITPNIGLEGLLKYNGLVGGGSQTYKSNLNLNIGFSIFLPSSKAKAVLKGK
jgi:hypothetical protein